MGDAVQKRFFFPRGFTVSSVGDDGAFGIAAAETFDGPDNFDIHQINVKNARVYQSMYQQRLGLIHTETVNNTVLFRIQTRANRLREIRVIRQYQNSFHRAPNELQLCPVTFTACTFSTGQALRSMETCSEDEILLSV
jgi:hypothetical protein